METLEKKWLVPLLLLGFIGLVILTNRPLKATWYDHLEEEPLREIPVTTLAGWIIEGRNDFIVIAQKVDMGRVKMIADVVYIDETAPHKALTNLPDYKKIVFMSRDGRVPLSIQRALVADSERRVVAVHGGVDDWEHLIVAETPETSALLESEIQQLNEVRSYFHRSKDGAPDDTILSPVTTPPPMLGGGGAPAEEGC